MGGGGLRPKIVIDKVAPDAIASKPRGDLRDIIMAWLGQTKKKVREQFDTEEKEEGSRLAMVTVAEIIILGSHQIRI